VEVSRRDRIAIGLAAGGGLSILAAIGLQVAAVLNGPSAAAARPSALPSFGPLGSATAVGSPTPSREDVVVDVEGAVRRPGVVRLPAGSRVADALQAAGGYSKQADLNAAAGALNLVAVLADGAQVHVPMIGATTAAGGGPSPAGGGGLVNLNTASPEELDALPGIGPVTVQKIVAARAEQPFSTLDEMVEREVIDRGQLEDIRDLVTL
jgi:competence protein ComEA